MDKQKELVFEDSDTEPLETGECICCGEELFFDELGVGECSNCDENYGTSKCKCIKD